MKNQMIIPIMIMNRLPFEELPSISIITRLFPIGLPMPGGPIPFSVSLAPIGKNEPDEQHNKYDSHIIWFLLLTSISSTLPLRSQQDSWVEVFPCATPSAGDMKMRVDCTLAGVAAASIFTKVAISKKRTEMATYVRAYKLGYAGLPTTMSQSL